MRFLLVLAVAVAILVAACSDASGGDLPTTATSTTGVSTTTTAAATTTTTTTTAEAPRDPRVPEQLAGLEPIVVALDDQSLLIALADTPELRRSGLMFVEDLGDLDGMLFIFEEDTSGGFWMKNTLLPLDIAFFDVDGRFVDGFVMEPCKADPCPAYAPSGSYRYALEMEEGTMPESTRQLRVATPLGED